MIVGDGDMCGILITDLPVDDVCFRRALHLMADRGPDAEGYERSARFHLGHRRLKVLDLDDRSNQPFRSRDGRFLILLNGEIYNFRELAKEWRIPTFTTCDTEVAVEMFARLGPEMLPLLNGMFSMAILDTRNGDLFVARDRLGIKPLYMSKTRHGLVLSSEIAPILELGVDDGIDDVGVRQYRKLRGCFNGRTIYRAIQTFPPGHYMKDGQIQRYWELPSGEKEPPSDEELFDQVKVSIERRLVADVPVGTFLSGGIDSSIITALAQPKDTWIVGSTFQNEFKWARSVAESLATSHHEVFVDTADFPALVEQMVRRRREPLSVPNEVFLYCLSHEAKQKDTVLLSGEGADELFFGYDRVFRWAATTGSWDYREFAELYAYGSHEDNEIVEDALSPYVEQYRDPLRVVSAFFQTAHLHGLLRRLDRSTMLQGLEARVPFVDHELVEMMAGVSIDYRMKDGCVKAPLKRVFADLVPSEILHRPKLGFPVPLDEVLFDGCPGVTGYDRFLNFNLSVLGCEINQGD